ncbi:hypothetical protein EVAR_56779_1, partial [Eumeta japonica]
MDIHNPRGVTSTLPASGIGTGYSMEGAWGDGEWNGLPELASTGQREAMEAVISHLRCETDVGIFPDAHDCRKFHLCSPPEDQPAGRPADHRSALCPMHYAFNASNAQCSVYWPYGQCQRKPAPECTKVGQSGALEDSLNHYYVCLSKQGALYPQIFICPHGYYFWNGFCQVDPPKEETNSEATVASLPSSSPTSSSSVSSSSASSSSASSSSASSSSASSESSSSEGTSTAAVSRSSVKSTEYPPDAFLADRFDLTNYETIDDVENVPQ